jgi:hypothetical protein
MDPTKEMWAQSIENQCKDEATRYICDCHEDTLFDQYSLEINKFFSNYRPLKEWVEVVNSNKNAQADNNHWVQEDDDILELVQKDLSNSHLCSSSLDKMKQQIQIL